MNLLLNIETAVESASVALAKNGQHIQLRANENTRDHAAWLHNNIQQLFKETGLSLEDLAAVAVSNGPGSYTGLRIGLSAAKGLCYALNIPLITIGTLEIMAAATLMQAENHIQKNTLIAPMIDARRMEVFTAVFDQKLTTVMEPSALVLDGSSYDIWLEKSHVIFSGNGAQKWKETCSHPNAFFAENIHPSAINMAALSYECYTKKQFADIAYTEPLYLKEFYTPTRG